MKQWIKKHGQILSLIPVILVMGMIFGFSCQTGEESGQTSDGVVSLLLQVFSPDFEELTPEAQAEIQNRVGFAVRKTAHFSEFALLGFFLMLHIRQLQKKHRVVLPWLWSWGIGTVYAMTDEAHQHFSAGRGPSLRDVAIDSSGVLAGTALMLLIFLLCRRRRLRRSLKTHST